MSEALRRKFVSEFLGTFFLLAIVVGSGIMGERLSAGNSAIALLANSVATGCGLVVLIWIFGPISGAHFNPLVTIISFFQGHHSKWEVVGYVIAQFSGAISGVIFSHLMFAESIVRLSAHDRSGAHLMLSEAMATFGLILVIRGLSKAHNEKIPFAVGTYIVSAYWFTSSTAFANPAVTVARSFTNSFAGIAPENVLGFVVAQCVGAFAAERMIRWLLKELK